MEPSEIPFPIHTLSSLTFRNYTAEDIKAISVKEITNYDTFDKLGHAMPGGLHDAALGCPGYGDVCGSCGLTHVWCPGHMGYIQLPVTVYNPMYFKILIKLLKLSCFHCYKFQATDLDTFTFCCKIKLINYGFISEVDAIDDLKETLMNDIGNSVMCEADIGDKLEEHVDNLLKETSRTINVSTPRHLEALRQKIVHTYLKTKSGIHRLNNCLHCKRQSRKIREQQNIRLIAVKVSYGGKKNQKIGVKKKRKKKKKGENDSDIDMEAIESEEEEEEKENEDHFDKKKFEELNLYLTPAECKDLMRNIWGRCKQTLKCLHGCMDNKLEHPTDLFFLDVLPVPPTRFRPVNKVGGMMIENGQTTNLRKVLGVSLSIKALLVIMKKHQHDSNEAIEYSETDKSRLDKLYGKTLHEKFINSWNALQDTVNCVFDGQLHKLTAEKPTGIKQLLEKKEGLFRKHMMGKRVDFAARSVISPDPMISTTEIGIPEVFAKKLTYPVYVTPRNCKELAAAVINGPNEYPGASVMFEDGQKIILKPTDKTQRMAIAKRLLTPSSTDAEDITSNVKIVHRHLINGDVLLLNRQPSLHRPSIQAHKARVLPKQRTLRLHYSNCKAYNADFDGDEMNAHFPQSELGRAEAYNLATTDNQYLVPKDGTPLGGLIQDHMVSGVNLTIRGRFFCRADYCNLVFKALVDKVGKVKLMKPAILKPQKLWSGKQIISTLLRNIIPAGKKCLDLDGGAKIPEKSWINSAISSKPTPGDMGESTVLIREGELLIGVLDKAHYGPTSFGLVHSCHELYGGSVSGRLLTCLGRLFTFFLQIRGFTLGIEDVRVQSGGNLARQNIIKESNQSGGPEACKAFALPENTILPDIRKKIQESHNNRDDLGMKELDICIKSRTDELNNKIIGVTMPKGLEKQFPYNNLQLMVVSGAKGSSVNCMQISSLLGQIELEGRRPPIMASGRSLPSFQPYDVTPKAGGFVTGRFLTGIKPQEYFFHCMAGREGLIDTAVKTSRSGYLQRCLIKHLESIKVNYDMTVRDGEGSIIQFYYGEDGLDILRTSFLKQEQFDFLWKNNQNQTENPKNSASSELEATIASYKKKIKKWREVHEEDKLRTSGFLNFCTQEPLAEDAEINIDINDIGRHKDSIFMAKRWHELPKKKRKKYSKNFEKCLPPIMSAHLPYKFGVVSENFMGMTDKFAKNNIQHDERTTFKNLLNKKYMEALVEPGEAVGATCAQSIGEPSTQMTLNTFHFAGRGEMNVTLGIPRLREILMVASRNLKTPSMEIPVISSAYAKKYAKALQKKLRKVYLSEVLDDISINESVSVDTEDKNERRRVFCLRFKFFPPSVYESKAATTPKQILKVIEYKYLKVLINLIYKKLIQMKSSGIIESARKKRKPVTVRDDDDEGSGGKKSKNDDDDADDDDDMSDNEELDPLKIRAKQKSSDTQEYEGEDEEMEEISDEENDDVEKLLGDNDDDSEEEGVNTMSADEEDRKEEEERQQKLKHKQRIQRVLYIDQCISDYRYDRKEELWCELTIKLNLGNSKLDLTTLVEEHIKGFILAQTSGINRCFITEKKGSADLQVFTTDGINIMEMFQYPHILQLNKFYTNDIHAMAEIYGIEAASRVLIKEIQNVFGAYGIKVDYRHLSLIADYMTFEGSYLAFNRRGLATNSSPLLKMTYESSMNYLTLAALNRTTDSLNTPSAQLITGKLVSCGTGIFDLLHNDKFRKQ